MQSEKKQPRILIVDDEPDNRDLMEAILERLGYASECACDGFEALEKLTLEIDLVLMDVNMPGMTGFQTVQKMREHPTCGFVPIIMVTALSSKQDRLNSVMAGANDFIGKPVDLVEVQIRIASLLKVKQAQDTIKRHELELEQLVAERTAALQTALEKTVIQATTDSLTGLPNRTLFADRLEHALARLERTQKQVAIAFLDLDNFKFINDSLGHEAGDSLLIAITERLKASVRSGDTVARLGGDEFTVLLEDLDDIEDAIVIMERIVASLNDPIKLNQTDIYTSVSIGMAHTDSATHSLELLLRDADTAMYQAKSAGKGGYVVFDQTMNQQAVERMELENGLRQALSLNELSLHYQPLVDLVTGKMRGMEALVRWNHPTRGLIGPGLFIPIAEETNLIVPIGYWVLEQACRQMLLWQTSSENGAKLTINVNMSGRQLMQPDVVERVADILARTQLPPESLKLEVTESVLMKNPEDTCEKMWKLKGLGVKLAIDDFGTGYSSLSSLSTYPIDTIKIDRSFISRLGQEENVASIVSAIIQLSKALHIEITGEGVETQEQVDYLQSIGCDTGQGYLFSKPISRDNMQIQIAQELPDYRHIRTDAEKEFIEKLLSEVKRAA